MFLVSVHEPDRRRVRRFVAALRPRASLRGFCPSLCAGRGDFSAGYQFGHGSGNSYHSYKGSGSGNRLHGSVRGGTPSSGVPVQPAPLWLKFHRHHNRDDHHQTGQVSGANSAGTVNSSHSLFNYRCF